jgi:ATP-dependent DNA helicase RecG
VETNLIESYELLMGFAAKHLLDKFYLEGDARVSLSSAISREMLVNCLMHREFTSSYIAQFVVEKERMYTANANRAETGDVITPENLRPNPKNPVISSFFRNIGLADELGSGVRNLYRYVGLYSGKNPELIDGDVFKIIVPLDDKYSFDAHIGNSQNNPQPVDITRNNYGLYCGIKCTSLEIATLDFLKGRPAANQGDIAVAIDKSLRTAQSVIHTLKHKGLLTHEGSRKNGKWIVKQ